MSKVYESLRAKGINVIILEIAHSPSCPSDLDEPETCFALCFCVTSEQVT